MLIEFSQGGRRMTLDSSAVIAVEEYDTSRSTCRVTLAGGSAIVVGGGYDQVVEALGFKGRMAFAAAPVVVGDPAVTSGEFDIHNPPPVVDHPASVPFEFSSYPEREWPQGS